MTKATQNQRRATAAQWAAANPILDDGEFGYETDTKIFKMGDGVTHWNSITTPYIPSSVFQAKGDLLVYQEPTTLGGNDAYRRLARGAQGSILGRDPDGNLVWVAPASGTDYWASILAAYIKQTDMAAVYKTKAAADSIHSQFELATHASSIYETKVNADIAHALHQYSANAATDYYTPAGLAAVGYEPASQFFIMTADATVTNTTTYTPVAGMSFNMLANATYIFEMYLLVTGTVANGMRISMLAPTCVSNIWGVHAPVPGAGATSGNVHQAVSTGAPATPGTQSIGLDGTTPLFAVVRGSVQNGSSAGTCSLSFAQNSAAASTSATIKADSYIKAVRAA